MSQTQRHVDSISDWCRKWSLNLNEGKCIAVRFTRKRCLPHGGISVGNFLLPWSQSVLYLGVLLNRRFSFKPNTERIVAKFHAARSLLNSFLCHKSTLSLKFEILLYLTFLRPVITYGTVSWSCLAKIHLKRLKALPSRILRTIISAPWFVRNAQVRADLKIPPRTHHKAANKQLG